MEWTEDWLIRRNLIHTSDVELGPDESTDVLECGSPWDDGRDGKLKNVTLSTTKLVDTEPVGPDPRLEGLDMKHPGTALLADATCFSCHQTHVQSVRPRYADGADR